MRLFVFWATSLLVAIASGVTPRPQYHVLPSLREQASLQDSWIAERKALLPGLLSKHGVDAWLISQREYAEDTVFWSLKAATQFSARRRTLILYVRGRHDGAVVKDVVAPSAQTHVLVDRQGRAATEFLWIDNTRTLWDELVAVLEVVQPKTIAVDAARELAFASGLHAGERVVLEEALGPKWTARLVSDVVELPIELVATMVPGRLAHFRKLMETAWATIGEAFSAQVIEPGKTTTTDVEWWMRERLQAQNMTTWFQPSATVLLSLDSKKDGDENEDQAAIQYGDLLHVDFGITALGLNTDTQHLAYVVPPGLEKEDQSVVPQGLRDGLKAGNRLQDIVRSAMTQSVGRSGNAILKDCRSTMEQQGLRGRIYSHPVGDWGHAAGTVIGMTNLQEGVSDLGELPLLANAYYSIELYASHDVPEYGNVTVNFSLEEDVYWDVDKQSFEWVYGRQEHFHLILPEEREFRFG